MATTETPPTAGIPLSEAERRIWLNIEWAQQNAEVQEEFAGEWVAIHERSVVVLRDSRGRSSDATHGARSGSFLIPRIPEDLAMSASSTLAELNRNLARKINEEARINPQSPYANKFVGIADGQVVL